MGTMNDTAATPAVRPALWRCLLAEFLGTALLVAIVVGSGIAATRLSPDDIGLQLLENSTATAFGLAVLILTFGPISGAHFNPVVSFADWLLGRRRRQGISLADAGLYSMAQIAGGIGGALLANAMFAVAPAIATTERAVPGTLLGEVVATAGLLLVIFVVARGRNAAVTAASVGAYIGAAYWFTSSTSFANPAVTIGRIFSDTFAGIAPSSAAPFIAAQLVGGLVAVGLLALLLPDPARGAAHAVADADE